MRHRSGWLTGPMRAIWSGAIAFGLVNVPVKAYAATADHDVPLHQVHNADGGRIRYQRRCEVCGEIVDFADIDKAYVDGETVVVLTQEDLASVAVEHSREVEVLQFVPSAQIDPVRFERSYYLEPDPGAAKAYVLLRETLSKARSTAVVKFTLRQKTRLGALRVRDSALLLQSLLWDDEVREPGLPDSVAAVKVSEAELGMAQLLVEQYSSDFTPESYVDEYQRQLRALVEDKISSGEVTRPAAPAPEPDAEAEVIDLMEALKRSVERHRRKGA